MGKSKPQDELAAKISGCFPSSHVSQEVYIGKLIEERGYDIDEIARELGNKPHRMFVDIVMRDSEKTVAFEYHGEQHYSLVGNMTKTNAELLLNQALDREKDWILTRIGIPLVAVPFDMYIDDVVLSDAIDKAENEVSEAAARDSHTPCDSCGRLFPSERLSFGICKRCAAEAEEEREASAEEAEASRRAEKAQRDAEARARRSARRSSSQESEDEAQRRKEEAREARRAAYKAYKESPEYQKQKEAAKQKRRELSRLANEKRKAAAKAERERRKEERRKQHPQED